MKVRFSGGTFLAAVVVSCIAWLMFYSRGTVAREAKQLELSFACSRYRESDRPVVQKALQQRIFEPAGMHDSGLAQDWATTPHAAVSYGMTRQGKFERAPVDRRRLVIGQRGIYSAVLDLQKLAATALDQEQALVPHRDARAHARTRDRSLRLWLAGSARVASQRSIATWPVTVARCPAFAQFQRFEDERVTLIVLTNRPMGPLSQITQALGSARVR